MNCSALRCEAFTIQLAIPDEIKEGWAVVESNTVEEDDDYNNKILPQTVGHSKFHDHRFTPF